MSLLNTYSSTSNKSLFSASINTCNVVSSFFPKPTSSNFSNRTFRVSGLLHRVRNSSPFPVVYAARLFGEASRFVVLKGKLLLSIFYIQDSLIYKARALLLALTKRDASPNTVAEHATTNRVFDACWREFEIRARIM